MKKAYNESWVENLAIQETLENWLYKKLITDDQNKTAKINFPEKFYRPGLFIKIGLFFFACIACCFFVGFITLFVADSGEKAFAVVGFLSCICFTLLLEYLIRKKDLFHSGVDNALLYAALAAAIIPFFILFEHLEFWQYCVIILIAFIAATLRYADIFVTAGSYLTIFALMANLMMKFPIGKALLPFAIMALATAIYFSIKKIKDQYYMDCCKVVEVLSLITLYLGGNYYVVREGNAVLANITYGFSPQIPFAAIFYSSTLLIPLLFTFFGLKGKDRILLLVGLFALAFSIFTYRYYFGFLTIAQGLTIAGIVMVSSATLCIRFFSQPKFGITDEPEGERKLANLESVLASQYLGQSPEEKSFEFGGGDFGGGGAGNRY